MSFQILYPSFYTIKAGSFEEAIKNYVKLNYEAQIANLIITDQNRYIQANLKYYKDNNKNKLGFSLQPISYPIAMGMIQNGKIARPYPYGPMVTYDNKILPSETFLDFDTSSSSAPLLPLTPLSPLSPLSTLSPLSSISSISTLSPLSSVISGIYPMTPIGINY